MRYNLIIRFCAEIDITSSTTWYDKKRKGLGASFLLSLDTAIQSIIKNPKNLPIVYKNIRRSLVRRFPYSIFYIIDKNMIIVLAVFHEKRNPKDWKTRV